MPGLFSGDKLTPRCKYIYFSQQRVMLCHTLRQCVNRKGMKLKSVNDMHVIVYLKTYPQPKTIKIIYKIFTKFKDLSTLTIFTRPIYIYIWLNYNIYKGKIKFKMDCDPSTNSILRCKGKFHKWFLPDRDIQQRNRYPPVTESIVLSSTSHLQEYS